MLKLKNAEVMCRMLHQNCDNWRGRERHTHTHMGTQSDTKLGPGWVFMACKLFVCAQRTVSEIQWKMIFLMNVILMELWMNFDPGNVFGQIRLIPESCLLQTTGSTWM